MSAVKTRKVVLLKKLRDTSQPGVTGVPCATCGKIITVNRRAYTPLSGSLFCHDCMQRSEAEMEALLENPQPTFLGYAARPLPDDVIILGGEG